MDGWMDVYDDFFSDFLLGQILNDSAWINLNFINSLNEWRIIFFV